jgi:predicted ABC-type ATPase
VGKKRQGGTCPHPDIAYGNSLAINVKQIGDKDRVDVILTNPPFGGEEETSVKKNFPDNLQTSETALLFLQLIMRTLARPERNKGKPGRAAVVVPNGAGKTTFAMRYLPRIVSCRNFVNADMIAQGLSPLDTHSVEAEAGRIFLRRINELIKDRADFAFETTLSGRAYARLFRRLRDAGFAVVLFYLWIPGVEFSAARVASRVENGGHDIPPDAIARRYLKSLRNLFLLYMPLADRTLIFDNSAEKAMLIADLQPTSERVLNETLFYDIKRQIEEQDHE